MNDRKGRKDGSMEKKQKSKNGKVKINMCLAVAMFTVILTSLAMSFEYSRARAGEPTTYTIEKVTVEGLMGKTITQKTIEISIQNGKLDLKQFYIGKDISDYFVNPSSGDSMYADTIQYVDSAYMDRAYIMPIGLKAIITEVSDTKLKCTVSGTPLSPSKQPILIWLRKSMFSEYNARSGHDEGIAQPASEEYAAYWKVTNEDDNYYGRGGIRFTSDQLTTVNYVMSGKAGETKIDYDFTIELLEAFFIKEMPKGTDVSSWFDGTESSYLYSNQLPLGLKVVTTSDVGYGDTKVTLKLSGTPQQASTAKFWPIIPFGYVVGSDNGHEYYCDLNNILSRYNNATFEFDVEADGEESPFIMTTKKNVVAYAGIEYGNTTDGSRTDLLTIVFKRYNFQFAGEKFLKAEDLPGYSTNIAEDTTYLYSNTEGKMNTDAPGFLYSPVDSGSKLKINSFFWQAFNYSPNLYEFRMQVKGMATKTGEYDITFFVPNSLIEGHEEEDGYTQAIKSGAKLILINPVQLEVDDCELNVKAKAKVDTFITVKTAYRLSLKGFKQSITAGNLKYTVSDKLTSHGLSLTPVSVNTDSVVFKLTGTVTGKADYIALADCVTFDYSNFDGLIESLGPVGVNANNDAYISINGTKRPGMVTPSHNENVDYGTPNIWVNGRDVKDKNDSTKSVYNKTYTKALSDLNVELPEGCKWVLSITDNTVSDVSDAFTSGKGKKSDFAKASYKKNENGGQISVASGKKAGIARIWIAAVDKKKNVKTSAYFDVTVGMAPKKMYLTKDGKGEKTGALKSIALNMGDTGNVFVNSDGSALSSYATFTWDTSKDTEGLLTVTPSGDTQSASISVKKVPEDGKVKKISITVTNNESGKKATLSVMVTNAVKSISGMDTALQVDSAKEEAVEKQLDYKLECYSTSGNATDKIKVYLTSALETGTGYSVTDGKKFKITAKNTSKIKVTYANGEFTIKVPKKTVDGTKVRVLIAVTHADKTVEVFESGVITVGTAT